MSPLRRGLLLAVIDVALIGAVAGVLLYDRASLPRVWVESAGVDPDLPIRGRYVALNLLFLPAPESSVSPGPDGIAVGRLQVRDGTAVALVRPLSEGNQRRDELLFTARQVGDGWRWMLGAPVAFFLPEHAPDPTRGVRPGELWVEATIPRKGAPRPIRLELRRE